MHERPDLLLLSVLDESRGVEFHQYLIFCHPSPFVDDLEDRQAAAKFHVVSDDGIVGTFEMAGFNQADLQRASPNDSRGEGGGHLCGTEAEGVAPGGYATERRAASASRVCDPGDTHTYGYDLLRECRGCLGRETGPESGWMTKETFSWPDVDLYLQMTDGS